MNSKKVFFIAAAFLFCFSAFASDWERVSPSNRKQIGRTSTELIIKTNVSNAEVYINGVYEGTTDLTVEFLTPGYYRVEIRKEGYATIRASLRVREGYSLMYKFKMEEMNGYLDIENCDSDCEVYVDGSRKYSYSHIELSTGSHTVIVKKFGYVQYKTYAYIEFHKTYTVTASFTPAPFEVTDFSVSKRKINPAYSNGLGKSEISFEVTNKGTGDIVITDEYDNTVWTTHFESFTTWSQSAIWTGRDNDGFELSDGTYKITLTAVNYVFEDSITIDSSLTFPFISYTPSGSGVGSLPAVYSVKTDYIMPFVSAEADLLNGTDSTDFYGVPLTAGVLGCFAECLEFGISGGGIIGLDKANLPDEGQTPFFVNGVIKADLDYELNANSTLDYGLLIRYGYSGAETYAPGMIDKGAGLGIGFAGGYENSWLYAGLSTELIWGCDTGIIRKKDAALWKNGLCLTVTPVSSVRLGVWGALHSPYKSTLSLQAGEAGVEVVCIPSFGSLEICAKVKALFFLENPNYFSGSICLSYLF